MSFFTGKICVVLILIVPLLKAYACPPTPLGKPCECINGYNGISVICKDARGYQEISSSLEALTGFDVTSLEIANSNLNYISHVPFANMSVSKLVVSDSSLFYLFDEEWTGDVTSSLVTLELRNVIFHGKLNWDTLSSLKNLLHIKVTKTNLEKLRKSFRDLSLSKVEVVILNDDNIGYMDAQAFKGFTGMKRLELSHNDLSKLERQMFPYPAAIQFLDLSNNDFQEFPVHMFDGMSQLNTLILNNNLFFTIDKSYMGKIFTQLSFFSITHNPIQCDYRLQWILPLEQPDYYFGQCTRPGTKTTTELKNLHEDDLYEKIYLRFLREFMYNF